MVLERLFRKSDDDSSLEIDLPHGAYEDCLSCRVVGSTALVSLGGYTYFSGMNSLRMQKKAIELSKSRYKYGSRQLGILGISATLVGMGIYRMFN